jgi:hypothetical protein
MTRVLQSKDEAVAYLQQGLKELRDSPVANKLEMSAYIIEMAQDEARSARAGSQKKEGSLRDRYGKLAGISRPELRYHVEKDRS